MSEVATPQRTRQMTTTQLESGEVVFDYGEGVEQTRFLPSALPDSIYAQAFVKGVVTQLCGAAGKLSGENRTPANLKAVIEKRLAQLRDGIWSAPREAGEGLGEISMEAEAAHVFRQMRADKAGQVYSRAVAESAADFAALTPEQVTALKATALYKLAYAKVKQDRNAKKIAKLEKAEVGEEEIAF